MAKEKKMTEDTVTMDAPELKEETTQEAEQSAALPEIDVPALLTELEVKETAVQDGIDRLKRLQADFDNFRRRTRQEKEELSAVVAQNLIKELLPLLDNFERAMAADVAAEASSLRGGVDMIYKQFVTTLEKNGMAKIEAVGQKFDPNFHEAVMRVADDSMEDDTIAEELQKGYSVCGRVIRPSMVKVVGN